MPFCPQCGVDNPESARYCDQCGAMLIPVPAQTTAPATAPATSVPAIGPTVCPQCGQAAIPGEAFCDNCGAPLSAPSRSGCSGCAAAAQRCTTATGVPTADAGHDSSDCAGVSLRPPRRRCPPRPLHRHRTRRRQRNPRPPRRHRTRRRQRNPRPPRRHRTRRRQRNPRLPDLQCRLRRPHPSADEHLSLHRCWLSSALALPCRCPQHRRQSSGAATRSVSFILISISIRMAHSIRASGDAMRVSSCRADRC
jgi:hypothetical protein